MITFNFDADIKDNSGSEYLVLIKRENFLLELPDFTEPELAKFKSQWVAMSKIKRKNKMTKLCNNILRLRWLYYN